MKKFLVSHTDEILHQRCDEVPFNNTEIITDLVDSFKSCGMLGLAAPQLGMKYACCVCMLSTGLEVLINPEVEYLGNKIMSTERCLSFPNILCKVPRVDKIKVVYFNSKWEKCERILENLDACVVQHEYDHLCGITMLDRAVSKQYKKVR